MTAAVIAFTAKGHALGMRIQEQLPRSGESISLTRCEPGALNMWTKANWGKDALIFIGASGIAVRAIAPYIVSKTEDPAVVAIDELGQYVIPLLSGHIGGANGLAERLARLLGAVPVITTATDVRGVFAVDAWAAGQGLRIANPQRIKGVSARLLAGEPIRIKSDFPIEGQLPEDVVLGDANGDVIISCSGDSPDALHLVPPAVTLGVGARKGTDAESIEQAFGQILAKGGCHPLAVRQVCSIDLKAREPGIVAFCQRHQLPFKTFAASRLMAVPGEFATSDFVKQVTGADNICERSAVLGSGEGGRLLAAKGAGSGVTMALAISPYPITFGKGNDT